jgi:cytidine deaminase
MSEQAWQNAPELLADSRLYALATEAFAARERAWAPYSGFRVGAALVGASGRIYLGVNVENASYGVAVCAERTAVVSAVAQGERRFREIVIVTDSQEPAAPCGVCRQTLAEFALAEEGSDLPVTLISVNGSIARFQLSTLLPLAFTPRSFQVRPGL